MVGGVLLPKQEAFLFVYEWGPWVTLIPEPESCQTEPFLQRNVSVLGCAS